MGTKLITYECVAPDHQPTANGADKLTFDVLLRHAGLSLSLDQRQVAAPAR